MRLGKADIAQSLLAELQEDERWLQEMAKVIGERQERVGANRRWLNVQGFSEASQGELTVPTESVPVEKLPAGQNGTMFAIAVDVLKSERSKTLSELQAALIARGKRVHRSSLNATLRRHPDIFDMKKTPGWKERDLAERGRSTSATGVEPPLNRPV